MPALLSVSSGTGLRVAPAPPPSSAPCSVDALERVMHFTGAGADACFYARQASTVVPAEGLRYWLNPSVRAQPTTATCEITNLGIPFFAATSAAVLRLYASPLLFDGRCFPTRCVVSLATSAQRLDCIAVRPVVLTEWSFSEGGRAGVAEAAVYTTAVPLRTLYHVASLMSTTTTEMEEVRLYLHLRFTGCSDTSDTHRIAAVRLTYEHLGSAAEVLPVLQQRRAHAAASGAAGAPATSPAVLHFHSALLDTSALVEEVEVTFSSGSSSVASLRDEPPHTPPPPPPPLRRPEQLLFIPDDEVESEWSSPPRRSTTKPRADASSRFLGTDLRQTPHSARQRSNAIVSSSNDSCLAPEEDGTALVRVERTLRLPPPPPPSSSSSASHRRDVAAEGPPRVLGGGGAPWPLHKTRTIVLAPSISLSLTSSSASSSPASSGFSSGSPLSSPESTCGSTPLCQHSVTCAAAATTTPDSPFTHSVTAIQPQSSHHIDVHEGRSFSDDGAVVGPLFNPPQRQRSAAADHATPLAASQTSPVSDFKGRPLRDGAPRVGSAQPCADPPTTTTSTAAVLWEATSLLGTVPWKLQNLQMSRRSSQAPSARGSRASSRERSHDATANDASREAPVSTGGSPSASFLPVAAWESSRVQKRGQQPPTAQEHSSPFTTAAAASALSRTTCWRAGDASTSIVAPHNGSSVSSFASWRCGAGFGEGSTRATPHLQPPCSATAVSSTALAHAASSLPTSLTSTSATNSPSAYVPRLFFRSTTATRAEVNQHARGGAGIGREGGPTLSTRHASTQQQQPPFPPSRKRDMWTRPTMEGSRRTHVAVAEHEQPLRARKPVSTASTATATTTSRHAPSAGLPTAPDTQVRSGPISVIPKTWLEQQWHQPFRDDQPRAVGRDQTRTGGHTKAPPAFFAKRTQSPPFHENGGASSTASSPDDVSLVKYSTDAVPAPPPPPPTALPPRSRVLFHSMASSPASSRSGSPPPQLPALPLQEAHHQQHHPRQKRVGRSRESRIAVGKVRRADQRRSRSAPVLRPVRPVTPVEHSSAAAVAPAASTGDVHAFSVVKHHVSRSGVGRRRLLIRPVPSQDPAGVRVFVALEKVRAGSHLREALGLGGSSGGGGASCEIPIRQSDVVEVWTGVQALQSGVIHREKVRSAECCVVLRCNRQLVTAVEMESAEAVDMVSHLVLPKR